MSTATRPDSALQANLARLTPLLEALRVDGIRRERCILRDLTALFNRRDFSELTSKEEQVVGALARSSVRVQPYRYQTVRQRLRRAGFRWR